MKDPDAGVLGVSILEGARFSCQGTGACCSGYVYGPIEDAVVRAVEGHRFTENAEHIHGPEGVSFYTRAKVVTARWPHVSHDSEASFHFPTAR